jgi:hypothetical protein
VVGTIDVESDKLNALTDEDHSLLTADADVAMDVGARLTFTNHQYVSFVA